MFDAERVFQLTSQQPDRVCPGREFGFQIEFSLFKFFLSFWNLRCTRDVAVEVLVEVLAVAFHAVPFRRASLSQAFL